MVRLPVPRLVAMVLMERADGKAADAETKAMSRPALSEQLFTVDDYLAFADARPRERYALLAGVPVAMAPPSYRHQKICGNLDRAIYRQIAARGCDVVQNTGIAQSSEADFLPEPDVMVRCGPIDGRRRWVNDPIVVIEVLSPSTMTDDRGYKLSAYQSQFESLRHIALVYQNEVRIETWARQEDGSWPEEPVILRTKLDQLTLSAVGASVPLGEIYDGVSVD
jgi:Uma2 family endonuclease